jgi:hypothetical protein
VELVLESGAVSAENILNVLARLNQAPPPEPVETSLQARKHRRPTPAATTAGARRRRIMRDVSAELNALRLYAMGSAWNDLTAQGGLDRARCLSLADRASAGSRAHGPGHARHQLSDERGPLPLASGPGRLRLRTVLCGPAPDFCAGGPRLYRSGPQRGVHRRTGHRQDPSGYRARGCRASPSTGDACAMAPPWTG